MFIETRKKGPAALHQEGHVYRCNHGRASPSVRRARACHLSIDYTQVLS
jgi:hypothetical protein